MRWAGLARAWQLAPSTATAHRASVLALTTVGPMPLGVGATQDEPHRISYRELTSRAERVAV